MLTEKINTTMENKIKPGNLLSMLLRNLLNILRLQDQREMK
jgi:hypothetical protein